MPTPLIKKYAEKTKKSIQTIERMWDEAKKKAKAIRRSEIEDKDYWRLVNGLLKKDLGLNEGQTFKSFLGESSNEEYASFVALLFAARDKTHELHLAAPTHSIHVTLNDLYEFLQDAADGMAEYYQGKYGLIPLKIPGTSSWPQATALDFITSLSSWLEGSGSEMVGPDDYLQNKLEEIIAEVYRTKYKLEQLK